MICNWAKKKERNLLNNSSLAKTQKIRLESKEDPKLRHHQGGLVGCILFDPQTPTVALHQLLSCVSLDLKCFHLWSLATGEGRRKSCNLKSEREKNPTNTHPRPSKRDTVAAW